MRHDILQEILDVLLEEYGQNCNYDAQMRLYQIVEREFEKGCQVGEYRAADKLYLYITTLWMFKNNLDNPKVGAEYLIERLLEESEKFYNDNHEAYSKHVGQLSENTKTVHMLYTVNREIGKGYSYAFDTHDEAEKHLEQLHPMLGRDWDRYILEQSYELEEDSHHDCGDDE